MHQLIFTHDNVRAAWSFEPLILLVLGFTALIYVWGMRGAQRRELPIRQWACFAGAMLALAIAFLSPLDELSHDLFWAHMTQHLILMMVAAPLLVLGELPLAILRALPRGWAQSLGRGMNRSGSFARAWHALLSPVAAWLFFAASMWLWHASALYEAALRNEAIHDVEHLCFILAAMLFWWVLFRHTAAEHVQYGIAIPYLFTTMLHSTVLGALMTFTVRPWYAYYAPLVGSWGLTPLQDQQLAGLIMWVPGGVVFTVLTIAYFAAWLRALERRSLRMKSRDEAHVGGGPL